jgi:hypothetical protein
LTLKKCDVPPSCAKKRNSLSRRTNMFGDLQPLSASLDSILSTGSPAPRGNSDFVVGSAFGERAWDELVEWFESEHEWIALVSSFEQALAS